MERRRKEGGRREVVSLTALYSSLFSLSWMEGGREGRKGGREGRTEGRKWIMKEIV